MFGSDDKRETGCILVIFGGTGDLTVRKLIPAIYSLAADKRFGDGFAAVLIGRRRITGEDFYAMIRESIRGFSRKSTNDEELEAFCRKVFYKRFDFVSEEHGYRDLDIFLKELDVQLGTAGNRLYYLAVSPDNFGFILEKLHGNHMLQQKDSFQRVLIEKPFGSGLDTARTLNGKIRSMINEEDIYRIDHYLGKEMIQNIVAVRFGNAIFESLWSGRYIDHVQITVSEQLGVENRGGYYDKTGILKDMVQNHILQMLALIAMEPPASMSAGDLRNEKIKVLKALQPYSHENAVGDISRGQYGAGVINGISVTGYREEERVETSSDTETFVALKILIDNERWKGVPFYIRTGKRLNTRKTEIVIQFKNLAKESGYEPFRQVESNLLVFTVQPMEGFYFRINTRTPGGEFAMEPVHMDYCQSCRIDVNSPEAYESLLQEAARGNVSFFISWEELESSWEYIESVEKSLEGIAVQYPNYPAGSEGPPDAGGILKREGRQWWNMDFFNCLKERK